MGGFYRPRDKTPPTSVPANAVNAARPEPMWIDMPPDLLPLALVGEAVPAEPVTVTNPPKMSNVSHDIYKIEKKKRTGNCSRNSRRVGCVIVRLDIGIPHALLEAGDNWLNGERRLVG